MGQTVSHMYGYPTIKVGGCGMDMHFATVYNLARSIRPNGHRCTGERDCPSNDHSNDWGRLARQYDAEHVDAYNEQNGLHETRTAYVAARSEWIAAQPTYDKSRMHDDGGYSLTCRSI